MSDVRWTLRGWLAAKSLRLYGCRCRRPLLGSWLDGEPKPNLNDGKWRVRCRLCNTRGRIRRRGEWIIKSWFRDRKEWP